MPTDINKGANIKEAEIREFTWLNFDENKALYKIVFKEKPGEEIKEVSAYWAWKRAHCSCLKFPLLEDVIFCFFDRPRSVEPLILTHRGRLLFLDLLENGPCIFKRNENAGQDIALKERA